MRRLLLLLATLWLAGCATYGDPYYSDRYYDRRYSEYYDDPYYASSRYAGRPWVYSSWHYDLYDPYSAMFHPFGYLYDPWGWDYYRFGVHQYSSRYWNFSFYGGRPWFYSPWYGGYGIYHHYGHYQSAPRGRERDGVPSYVNSSRGESAQSAASGLAAEIHGGRHGSSLVRNSAVRMDRQSAYGGHLLGSMVAPGPARSYSGPTAAPAAHAAPTSISRAQREAAASSSAQGNSSLRSRTNEGLPVERAGFRPQPANAWRSSSPVAPAYGAPGSSGTTTRYYLPPSRSQTGVSHPWRDTRSPAYRSPGANSSMRSSGSSRPSPGSWSPSAAPRMQRSESSFSAPRSMPSTTPTPSSRSSSGPASTPSRRGGRDHD